MTDSASQYQVPEVDELLDDAIEIIASARPMPMSATVKVNRDEVLDLLEAVREQLPEELRRARWLLKEREDFLDEARHERDDIIAQGRSQVAHMVERQEIVKAAELRARQIISQAKADARTLQHQVEDYCDQKLASFEIALDRTRRTIQEGRERLLGDARGEQMAQQIDQLGVSEEAVEEFFSEVDLRDQPSWADFDVDVD